VLEPGPAERGQQLRLPAAFMRGGTSKGLFFRGGVLPDDTLERNRILSRAIGGGDPFRKQIDGLDGATSSTSKAVVVSRSKRPGFDVDYLFAQVGVDTAHVDWQGSCGNLASAVGPFAIEEGLVEAVEGVTTVRIWQVNTGKEILAHVPTRDGQPQVEGDFKIDGVAHLGAEIKLDFMEPGGGLCGRLLPTGSVKDRLQVEGLGGIEVTMVDAGNPCVMVAAADVGLSGSELPDEINADPAALARLEAVRAAGAVRRGEDGSRSDCSTGDPRAPLSPQDRDPGGTGQVPDQRRRGRLRRRRGRAGADGVHGPTPPHHSRHRRSGAGGWLRAARVGSGPAGGADRRPGLDSARPSRRRDGRLSRGDGRRDARLGGLVRQAGHAGPDRATADGGLGVGAEGPGLNQR